MVPTFPSVQESDTLFLSPTILTGEEDAVPYEADVFVSNGVIAQVGPDLSASVPAAVRRVQAKGLVLCPGFIDMHAHSDLAWWLNPDHEPKITQGITTEIVGQDGISYFPVRTPQEMDAIRTQIAAWNGNPTPELLATKYAGTGMFEWRTVKEYLDCLDRNKPIMNVAVLVPQGNLRLLAVGPNDTPATEPQLEEQAAMLKVAMNDGAIGMSSGLTYTPGMYASHTELAYLCKELADNFPGAYYGPHHRSYTKGAMEAFGEMLDLGRQSGIPVHFTHCKIGLAENVGKGPELIKMFDDAVADGVKVSLDSYPYTPGSTTLSSLLPSWCHEGGPSVTMDRLQDLELRKKIQHAMEDDGCHRHKYSPPVDWNTIEFAGLENPELVNYVGKTVAAAAKEMKKEPIDIFYEVLTKDNLASSVLIWTGNEESMQVIMKSKYHTGGSDAILIGGKVHPRAYGCFPRFLGEYVREQKLMPLAEMVAHLTSRPAKVLGIYPQRGVLQVGSAADLVLFNPETVKDMATYESTKEISVGIEMVLVNGVVALDHGKITGGRGGATLRRRADGKVTLRGH
ncbi:hypothetical protein MNV49_005230 [Pseudohyphozyma bogoriensis]|nr:hypothetical protein MNV49_005230 [Pseudohyphozyma bogoriensis]